MSTGALVVIIIVVIVAAAVVIAAMAAARRRRLQQRFGPEYDRVVGERGSQLKAESELAGRERRIRSLEIRPLSDTARANYASSWRTIQEQFVDQPENSVVKAQALVTTVMKDRGYPVEGHDQMLADLSVEHASTLEQYRLAHTISQSAAQGQASTEDLRQAMIKYRALFSDLLGGAVAPEGAWLHRKASPRMVTWPASPPRRAPRAARARLRGFRDGRRPRRDARRGRPRARLRGFRDGRRPRRDARRGRPRAASEVSAMNADPAGTDPVAADPATAGVPDEELRREPARRRGR